jgi:hypothetical protein
MSSLGSIYHIVRADLLERVRSYSFMVVMVLTVLAGYLLVPPYGAAYTSFVIGSHRGYYNSPWVGLIYGIVACTLLALFGFYLVKNTVERDERTRVGQIIASTPVRKGFYTLGKWLSNLALLSLILVVLTLMAPLMQYVRGEEPHIDLLALVTPIWLMGFPALALVSAMAIFFECLPVLRGGLGNVVYFFIWGPVLVASISATFLSGPDGVPHNDFAGVSRALIDVHKTLTAGGFDANQGVTGVVGPVMDYTITRFTWNGIPWTADIWFERLIWLGGALLVALAASIPFGRFDPARQGITRFGKRLRSRVPVETPAVLPQEHEIPQGIQIHEGGWAFVRAEALNPTFGLRGFLGVLKAEFRLMFKGLHWTWYLVAAGLVAACLLSPVNLVSTYLLPAAWIWPLTLWSQMGSREYLSGTSQIVFSVPQPARRQLPALWLAGITVAGITGFGAALNYGTSGAWMGLLAWAGGVLFIPALALMLGVWTRSRRVFEMVYLLWWYLAFNGVPALDFIGTTQAASERSNPWVFVGLAVTFFIFSWIGRSVINE